MKTIEQAEKCLEKLEAQCRRMYSDECGADGIYLSDGVYVDALEYALMHDDLTEKQEKLFDQAMNILHPWDDEYEAIANSRVKQLGILKDEDDEA